MKKEGSGYWKWIFAIVFLLVLGFISLITAGILSLFFVPDVAYMGTGNVALIEIKGPIIIEGDGGIFGEQFSASSVIVPLIEEASKNENIKAILLDINSGGGSPVGSDEIASAIKDSNKTTVALIRGAGASGAYWIASATDHIIANRMSLTGSIGVIGSYLEFGEFLDDYNISYQRFVSGKHKDIASPFKEPTSEERDLFQGFIDRMHVFFISDVAENRNMSYEDVEKIATGLFYIGAEAYELGLVDELGSRNEAVKYLEAELNETVEMVSYKRQKSFFESLSLVFNDPSYLIGRGIGDSMFESDSLVRT